MSKSGVRKDRNERFTGQAAHSRLRNDVEAVIGVAETHGITGAGRRVAPGPGQETLADTGQPRQEGVTVT
ncbi:MAG: hypothetical protein OXF79_01460 [Chloroflexi bacterium]|nr:hypothetical protein [Chloroflexota bacterium]